MFYNIRTEIRTLGQGIVVPLNWIGLVDLILPYIHLTDFLVEEKFSWLPSKIKRLWKQFAFSEPHKFSRQITRFNLFLILSFFYNIRTEFRTQHAEEDDPERLQQIIGQVHHMFSRFVKLWIYDFFSQNFLCFLFLQGRSFLLRWKNAEITVYHNRKRHIAL